MVKHTQLSKKFVLLSINFLLLLGTAMPTKANEGEWTHHGSPICTKRIKARELCSRRSTLDHVSSRAIFTELLCTNTITAYNVCATTGTIENLCTNNISVDQLCTTSLSSTNVCVNGNIEHCTAFKALVGFAALLTTYTLGDLISFDTIVDDPDSDITSNPTQYLVPISGYYIVTLQAMISDISGTNIIAGIPVSVPTIFVNGVKRLDSHTAFLSFSNIQNSTVSGLLRLQAGDVITTAYDIIVLDPINGLSNYVGTANLIGTPNISDSYFSIHYLSSDCPVPCTPCTVQVCEPCTPHCPTFTPCHFDCHCDCCHNDDDE
jgi:hypothetical protein